MAHDIHVKFDFLGKRAFSRRFVNLEEVPKDFREPFAEMADDFLEDNRETFDQQGPGWRPLSPRYAAWKERHYPGRPILVRTGALRLSLTERDAYGQIREIQPQMMELGTKIRYAIYHQTGSIKIPDHPPKRSPIVLSSRMRVKWTKRIVDWLRREFDYSGE